jgi:hypothetical protein
MLCAERHRSSLKESSNLRGKTSSKNFLTSRLGESIEAGDRFIMDRKTLELFNVLAT